MKEGPARRNCNVIFRLRSSWETNKSRKWRQKLSENVGVISKLNLSRAQSCSFFSMLIFNILNTLMLTLFICDGLILTLYIFDMSVLNFVHFLYVNINFIYFWRINFAVNTLSSLVQPHTHNLSIRTSTNKTTHTNIPKVTAVQLW